MGLKVMTVHRMGIGLEVRSTLFCGMSLVWLIVSDK
jgi:hypothetical protein